MQNQHRIELEYARIEMMQSIMLCTGQPLNQFCLSEIERAQNIIKELTK